MPDITEQDCETIENAAGAAMRAREYQTAVRAYALALRLRMDLKAAAVDMSDILTLTPEQQERLARKGGICDGV